MVGSLLLTFADTKLGVSWGVPLLCGRGSVGVGGVCVSVGWLRVRTSWGVFSQPSKRHIHPLENANVV